MAFTSNWPVQNPGTSLSSSMSGGWGASGQAMQDQQKNETLFNSLLPVNGMVTGEQVKPVFQASGLPQSKLAQIWSMVDQDRDGRINKMQFFQAMGLIQKARQQERPSLFQSQPAGFFSSPQSSQQFSTPTSSLNPTPNTVTGSGVSHSVSVPTFKQQPAAPPPSTPTGGVGIAVSLNTLGDGWAMKMRDRRRYIAEFNTLDRNMTGYLAGAEVRPILTKSNLNQATLAQIWALSDVDKDGRLTAEEFVIAMHLMEKAKAGVVIPKTLPPELKPRPGLVKFSTVDVPRKASIDRQSADRQRKGSLESPASFEDRRKENFEAGRMELDRRRKSLMEQQEKEAAEKERKRREEEERRKQQELEAELARQAELERQRRKAQEIELERERQMQKLALQREAEQRELERQRKEEWARRRQLELEGQREWERKTLRSLMDQHLELEEKLNQLDQRKLIMLTSVERHKALCSELSSTLRSLRLSHDVRKAELTKLRSEFAGFQAQLSSLERQRKELQEALQSRSPEALAFQRQRQQYRDKIMGLAAFLAGLRTNLNITSKSLTSQEEAFSERNKKVEGLRSDLRSSEPKVKELRMVVGMRKKAWDDHQRKLREAAERQAEMERKQREEKERLARMAEERAQREVRLAKIRQQQEEILRIERERKASEMSQESAKGKRDSATPPGDDWVVVKPVPLAKPVGLAQRGDLQDVKAKLEKQFTGLAPGVTNSSASAPSIAPLSGPPPAPAPRKKKGKKEEKEKDKEVLKKVQELQKKKAELQRQKELQSKEAKKVDSPNTKKKPPPVHPAPYALKMTTSAIIQAKQGLSPPSKRKKPVETTLEAPLVDLQSSWDSSAQRTNVVSLHKASSTELLEPIRSPVEALGGRESSSDTAVAVGGKPIPKKRASFVEKPFSQLFEKTGASEYVSSTHAGSSGNGGEREVPSSAVFKPIQEPVSGEVSQSRVTEQEAVAATTGGQDHDIYIQYRAKYNFEAGDSSEVSFKEGDIITAGAHPSEEASPGWAWVEVGGSKGWAPELYLEPLERPLESEGRDGCVEEEGESGEGVPSVEEMGEEELKEAVLSPEVPKPTRARVKFSWQGSKDNHLSIQRGEFITVLQQSDKWWSGEAHGMVGWFPKSFVTIIEEEPSQEEPADVPAVAHLQPEQSSVVPEEQAIPDHTPQSTAHQDQLSPGEEGTGPTLYEAIYDYEGEAEGDLSFKTGDVIQVIAHEGVWWIGTLGGVKGEFPSNYVQKCRTPSPTGSITSFTSESALGSTITLHTKPIIARALVAFHAQREDQLSLTPGEYIKVRKQAASGWWEGELQSRGKQRQAGWFPANRVEVLTSRSGSGSGMSNIIRARSPLLEIKSKPNSQTLVLALYSYVATSPDELNFHKGSVITVLSKEEGDWWRGELNGQVGLFPSNYVQPLTEQQQPLEATRWADSVSPQVLAAVSDKERKRQEAIFELLSSERNYIDSLKLVKEVFFDPIAAEQVLTQEELSKVRVNWDELIKCNTNLLNTFLVRLRTSGAVVRNIGDVLSKQIPDLTPHIRWCSCQLTACTLLQSKSSDTNFREFEQRCMQDSRTGGLPLSSFLLKPMQRITRYPLLIKRILDYTPEGAQENEELKAALEQAEKLCIQVNEAVRSKENTEQLEWLQTHVQLTLDEGLIFNSQTNFMGSRKLLHWGKLFKIRGAKDMVGFLFNDFFLLVRPKHHFARAAPRAELEPFTKNEFQMYKQPWLLDGVRVKKASQEQYGPSAFLFLHPSEEKDVPLRADNDTARDQWTKKIMQACMEYMQTKKKMEREQKQKWMRTLKDSVGVLKVKIVEAADLLASDANGKSDPFCVVKLGDMQEQKTEVIPATLNPKWNCMMDFAVRDINTDVLEISVFDKDLFSPNDFLGCTKLAIKDLLRDGDSPWNKRLLLEDVANGEIELTIELELKKSGLLL